MPALGTTWRTDPKLGNWNYNKSAKTGTGKVALASLNSGSPAFRRPCLIPQGGEELLPAIFMYCPEYHRGSIALLQFVVCETKGIVVHRVYLFIVQKKRGVAVFLPHILPMQKPSF